MNNYLDLMNDIMIEGEDVKGRNGYTRRLFARQLRWDLRAGFPAVTTKQLFFKLVKSELLWFLKGTSDLRVLRDLVGSDKTIWDHDQQSERWQKNPNRRTHFDDVGRIYGVQWRDWNGSIDQIAKLVIGLRLDPASRYHVVTAWNPGELDKMCLPACHMGFQCFVGEHGLSLAMTQRSCDMFLGVPFNIASYALLTHMLAQVIGRPAHELVITFNDAHIYHKHFEAVKEQLGRNPLPLPRLWLNPLIKDIDDFSMDDIKLLHYKHHPAIRAEIQ